MANEPSRKIGSIDCVVCGEVMPVKLNGRDTLNLSCPWCGFSAYAKGGTDAHGIVSTWLRKGEAEDPQPAATPAAPVPEAAPTPSASLVGLAKTAKKAFDMGAL